MIAQRFTHITCLAATLAFPFFAAAQPPTGKDIQDPRLPAPLVPPNPPGTAAPVFPRVAASVHAIHEPTPVPPTLEIEVLDPNVDARGNPAVLTKPFCLPTPFGPDGRVAVDIPPTVLVHRYYYTGNRSFVGPMLPGGPSIVVAHHPRTGERLYVSVMMLPGAPRVVYTSKEIEYDYGTQAIIICFGACHPKVVYRQGVPVTKKMYNTVVCTAEATRQFLDRTGLPECNAKIANATKSFALTTADRINDVGRFICGPPTELVRRTPLGSLFTSSPENLAIHERDALIRRAEVEARQTASFISTNR